MADLSAVKFEQYEGGGNIHLWIEGGCRAAGVPDNDYWKNGMMVLCERESSFRPNAVNDWDRNATGPIISDHHRLNCSRGVAQCIPDVFSHYHAEGTSWNIYDPIANIAASIKYIVTRYHVSVDGHDLSKKVRQADSSRGRRGYVEYVDLDIRDDDLPDYLDNIFDDVPELLPGEDVQEFSNTPIDTHLDLPADGSPRGGLYCTHTPTRLYGTQKTIEIIQGVGASWEKLHPDTSIGIGDISKLHGGPLSGHASHRKGIDFDVRLMRKDHKRLVVTIHDEQYSRDLTKELIYLFIANGLDKVTYVFFNDKALWKSPIQYWPNHDNHFHVRLAAT